jgi:hypothetical protein
MIPQFFPMHRLLAAKAGIPIAVCALWPCPAAASRGTEVDVVVDFTEAGRRIMHPAPGNPAYYYPVLGGFEELGSAVAGEKPPRPDEVAHAVAVELAKQGYLEFKPSPYVNRDGQVTYRDGTVVTVPGKPGSGLAAGPGAGGDVPLTLAMLKAAGGPYSLRAGAGAGPAPVMDVLRSVDPVHGPVMDGAPSLILHIRIGYINPQTVETAAIYGVNGETLMPAGSFFTNQGQMLGLVGGRGFRSADVQFDGELTYQRAEYNRYFLVLDAYDFQAYRRSRELVPLWQAKMSCNSDGVGQFADVLDALVLAGGPHFGRETRGPRFVTFPVTPDGRVEIGEPREVGP